MKFNIDYFFAKYRMRRGWDPRRIYLTPEEFCDILPVSPVFDFDREGIAYYLRNHRVIICVSHAAREIRDWDLS